MAIPMERTAGGSTEFVENISEHLHQETLCAASLCLGLEGPRPECAGCDLAEEVRKRRREEKKLFWAEVFEMWRQERRIQDEKDEQELEMKALMRQQDQEREEIERERREKEEAMANHERLMTELKSRTQALIASTEHLAGPVTAISKPPVSKCRWWSIKKRQAPTDTASQDAYSCPSPESNNMANYELENIKNLEKMVRKAEQKKQQKALAKAQKKAEKEEKKNKKDDKKNKAEKVKDSHVTGFWPHFLLSKGYDFDTDSFYRTQGEPE